MSDILLSAYTVMVLIGAIEIVWMMTLIAHKFFMQFDTAWVREIRRFSLAIVGLALCGALLYGLDRGWQPWPPDLALLFGIDLYFGTAIYAAYRRLKIGLRGPSHPTESVPARYR